MMPGFVQENEMYVSVSEDDDGTRTLTVYTQESKEEVELRPSDEAEARVTAGTESNTVGEDGAHLAPTIKAVSVQRFSRTEVKND